MKPEDMVNYIKRIGEIYKEKKIINPIDLMDKFHINVADAIEILEKMRELGYINEIKEGDE